MSNSARRPASKRFSEERAPRRAGSGRFPIAPERGLADALLDALERLERARLATTHRENPDDDDEDPTRRVGAPRPRH